MRGNTKKYLPVFRQYVTQFGWDEVEKTLRMGKGDKTKLKLPINRKDRNEILIELRKEKRAAGFGAQTDLDLGVNTVE